MISDDLTPGHIQNLADELGLEMKIRNNSSWITCWSPLREEGQPSFGFNVKSGAWKDHGTGETGDIVTLVELLKGMDNKEAVKWIAEQTDISGALYGPPNNGHSKPKKDPVDFWNDEKLKLIKSGINRLKKNPEHPLLKTALDYDCLKHETLQTYGCGIIEKWGKEWLAFPYATGCQLYRRDDGKKMIRSISGSAPGSSFFGEKLTAENETLLIAKSPREAMLLHQVYGHQVDVIGLCTGEQSNVSNELRSKLTEQVSNSLLKGIYTFLDCDTESALQTAQEFTTEIALIAEDQKINLVNIYKATGCYKDLTDCFRAGMDKDLLSVMLKDAEPIAVDKSDSTLSKHTNHSKQGVHVQPEGLRLTDELIELMPPVVKNFLNYASPLSDVPNEFLLTPFLAITGAAIGKKRFVKVGGMEIYPTIWTVLFAGSSTLRKSTGLTLAKKPFKPIEEHYKEVFEKELSRWEQERNIAKSENEDFDRPKPIKRTIYCSDGFSDLTFWEGLRDNGSLISTPGEFTALWSELTRPRNSMKDLALSIFDAEDSIRRNTKSAGDIELQNPVWCLAGATTLSSFQQALSSTERGSGLLQRILPVCMEERTKKFKALTELQTPNAELYNEITNTTEWIKGLEPQAVTISPEAEELFTEWSHKLNSKAEKLSDKLPDIGGYVSRLNVYGLKFGLIFQQLDNPGESISERNMKAGIAICEWLLLHIIYMLDRNYIFNRHYADRIKIRELIAKQPNMQMSRTDLMNMSHFDKDQLDKALSSEIEAGEIEEIKIETGGRPLTEYKIKGGA